ERPRVEAGAAAPGWLQRPGSRVTGLPAHSMHRAPAPHRVHLPRRDRRGVAAPQEPLSAGVHQARRAALGGTEPGPGPRGNGGRSDAARLPRSPGGAGAGGRLGGARALAGGNASGAGGSASMSAPQKGRGMPRASLPVYPHRRTCTQCFFPETQETLVFDGAGVCNVCRQIEYKQTQVDWAAKEREFVALIEQYRDRHDYDCIVPFSGGKDSTFTLYTLVAKYRVKPLVVRFDHGFLRPTVLENSTRTIKKLGVDVLHFRPNWRVVQKLMRESLRRKGDFCWHCHTGIFSYPMHIAVKFKIPLVIWGEPSAEYVSYYTYEQPEEVDEKRFNRFVN